MTRKSLLLLPLSILFFYGCDLSKHYYGVEYYNVAPPSSQEAMDCSRSSPLFKNYYGRYAYYKSIFKDRNEVLIPITIHIWQKDDGSANYADTPENRKLLKRFVTSISQDYTHNLKPTDPIPGVVDYSTTKIHVVLDTIYFNQSTACWKMGNHLSYREGKKLNDSANILHPESKNNFKIHFTGASPSAKGYSQFPTYSRDNEHFIVTFNKTHETIFHNKYAKWSMPIHFDHELAHNLDLYHNYSRGKQACVQSNPDYLDDVFGRGENQVCPQEAGWGCDPTSPDNTCTNNIMGGTSGGRYFSPKQILRMHRALALKSIRKYAVAYNFDDSKYIDITTDQTWDFDIKMYTNLKIHSGVTLTIKCAVHFVPQAKIVIEDGGKLIIDGGKLTNESYYNDFWQGIKVWVSKKEHREAKRNNYKYVELINGGVILYAIQ